MYDSEILYARVRSLRAKRSRQLDAESWKVTERNWRQFGELDYLISRRPYASEGGRTLAPRQAVNAEVGPIRREWRGMKGHHYPKNAKAQTVKNSQGQTVVVMSPAQRDAALMRKLGMSNHDMD